MMSNTVITKDDQTNNDVYAGVSNFSTAANTNVSYEDQQMLEAIQRKLGVFTQNSYVDMDENSDVKPTQSTMSMTYKRDYTQGQQGVDVNAKLSTKSKVAIASYVAVVLVLVLAVAFCAATINGSFAAVLQGEQAYNEVSSDVSALEQEVNTENYNELYDKALQMGFVEANPTNSYQYTQLPTRPAQNFTVESNWFDQMCNWLSAAFGG